MNNNKEIIQMSLNNLGSSDKNSFDYDIYIVPQVGGECEGQL